MKRNKSRKFRRSRRSRKFRRSRAFNILELSIGLGIGSGIGALLGNYLTNKNYYDSKNKIHDKILDDMQNIRSIEDYKDKIIYPIEIFNKYYVPSGGNNRYKYVEINGDTYVVDMKCSVN